MFKNKSLAEIQYLGVSGITERCIQALIGLIHSGSKIDQVKILSHGDQHTKSHALLLIVDETEYIIKNGFASGYPGEAPKGYSFALSLLYKYTQLIDEYVVTAKDMKKIENSSLTYLDLDRIHKLASIRPARFYEHINYEAVNNNSMFTVFPSALPLSIIDSRLIDIAISFDKKPDSAILDAYRKIEAIVRERTEFKHESSTKLFKKAFFGEQAVLHWRGIDAGVNTGRANLFVDTFMAYRNNRAHQEPNGSINDDIREFLLINQLFVLEGKAVLISS